MTDTLDAIQRPGGGLRRMLKQVAGQPYPMIVLVGSLMLSAASFFTTFEGMLNFMPILIITFCIVFAVQGLLFVTSWRIGFAVAERERWPLFTTLVFLICLATSSFFSWVALYDYINDDAAQERTRIARMQRAVESNTGALAERLADKRETAVLAMISADAFGDWEASTEKVAEAALAARKTIEAAQAAEAEQIAEQLIALDAERAEIVRGQATSEGRIAAQQRKLAQLEEARPELVERAAAQRTEFEALREQVIVKEGEMEAEEKGGLSGGGTGKGPVWRRLRDERAVLAAQRDAKERLYEQAQQELRQLDADIETLSADIAVAGASDGSVSPEIALVDKKIGELRTRLETIGGGNALDADVDSMRAAVAAFKSRHDMALFDQAGAVCGRLLGALRADPVTSDSARGLSCDTALLATQLTPIRAAMDREAALAAACVPGGASAPVLSELSFSAAEEHGRACITMAGLASEEVEPLRQKIERLKLEEDPNASGFVRAVNGWISGDKLAYLAAAIALFIDLLVLFSGLIGALSSSGKLQLALGGILTKREIEDFERALRPEVAQFILDKQQSFEPSSEDGRRSRTRGELRYAAHLNLDQVSGTERMKDRAKAFMIAQKAKKLVVAARSDVVDAQGRSRKGRGGDSQDFWLSDELMRGLRAYLESPESHRLADLPKAGDLAPYARREAARAIREKLTPYRASMKEMADWPYAAIVQLSDIDPEVKDDAASQPRRDARQVLVGLYSEGLAKPAEFSARDTTKHLKGAYLLKEDALGLLDRAARLTEEEAQLAADEQVARDMAERYRLQAQKQQLTPPKPVPALQAPAPRPETPAQEETSPTASPYVSSAMTARADSPKTEEADAPREEAPTPHAEAERAGAAPERVARYVAPQKPADRRPSQDEDGKGGADDEAAAGLEDFFKHAGFGARGGRKDAS